MADLFTLHNLEGQLTLARDHWVTAMRAEHSGIHIELNLYYETGAARELVHRMLGSESEISLRHVRSAMEEYCNLCLGAIKRSLNESFELGEAAGGSLEFGLGIPATQLVAEGNSVEGGQEGSPTRVALGFDLPGVWLAQSRVEIDTRQLLRGARISDESGMCRLRDLVAGVARIAESVEQEPTDLSFDF